VRACFLWRRSRSCRSSGATPAIGFGGALADELIEKHFGCFSGLFRRGHSKDDFRLALLNIERQKSTALAAFVRDCDTECAGGPGPSCVILEDLSKPSACKTRRAG
jgi:hypothetical protein